MMMTMVGGFRPVCHNSVHGRRDLGTQYQIPKRRSGQAVVEGSRIDLPAKPQEQPSAAALVLLSVLFVS